MKLTPEEHKTSIAAQLALGSSYREIAEELGCNKDTVARFVKKHLPDQQSERVNGSRPPSDMQILILDIETRPALAYVWGAWKQNVLPAQIVEDKATISFAARWYGSDGTMFFSDLHGGHNKMVRTAHKLLDTADAVVHYNGKRFDIPHLNQEFKLLGLAPPSPYRQVDLLLTVRKKFNFTHNKLDHIARKLLHDEKVEHEGFMLWVKCMSGDREAWERMREYNVHDVKLTEELYTELLPWIDGHPSHAAFHADTRCPTCASENLKANGYVTTKTGKYKAFQCRVCGAHGRDTHRSYSTLVTPTAAW